MKRIQRKIAFLLAAALFASAIPALAADTAFRDVKPTHWAREYIEQAFADGAVNGTYYNERTGERWFEPEKTLTVAEFAAVLTRAFFPKATSVAEATKKPSDKWYAPYMKVANDKKLFDRIWDPTKGTEAVSPEQSINRYVMAVMIANVTSNMINDRGFMYVGFVDNFGLNQARERTADIDSVPKEYEYSVLWAVGTGILNGVDSKGTFAGNQMMTRAQMATVYCRARDLFKYCRPENDTDPAPDVNTEDLATRLLNNINSKRASQSLGTLALDEALCEVAQIRAQEIVSNPTHTRPNGETVSAELKRRGIACNPMGENIAVGYDDPGDVVEAWKQSTGHNAVMMLPEAGKAGIGYVHTNSGYKDYWILIVCSGDTAPASPDPVVTAQKLMNGKEATVENVLEMLEDLKANKYPDGTYYEPNFSYPFHVPLDGSGQAGKQCAKLAFMISDDIFGYAPARRVDDFMDLRPGDIIRSTTHWSICISYPKQFPTTGEWYVDTVGGGSSGHISWAGTCFSYNENLVAFYTRY
ncbi:MAG: S-layer homology domain-containing protein [Clostridia bacterium]|nr:S-layer homology domain-containing protein [Clostridia bacterium]